MKMFLIETLLNLVIYVRNVHSKKHRSTVSQFIISIIVILKLKVPRTISFNCCACMFQQYCTRVSEQRKISNRSQK